MKTLEDKENIFLERREVRIIVESNSNPSYEEAMNIICKNFNSDKDLVVIKGVKGKFGRKTFLISAFIYKDKESREKFERKPKKSRQETEQKEAEKKQEAPTPTQNLAHKSNEKEIVSPSSSPPQTATEESGQKKEKVEKKTEKEKKES